MGCQRSEGGVGQQVDLLRTGAAALDIALDAAAAARFDRYFELLAEHGSRFNLTGILDQKGVQRRHFLESLAVGAALRREGMLQSGGAAIDVGSGAGFPGLPLRIAWPELRLTLLEATRKKAVFLQLVANELELTGVQVVNARAEDAGHQPELRERFDLVVARAVASLPALAELTLPFARMGGLVSLVKGSRLDEELDEAGAAIRACGGGRPQEVELGSDRLAIATRLLIIPKAAQTPRGLPRAAGVPSKRPLR